MFDHMGFRVRDDACAKALNLATIDNTEDSFLLGRSAKEPLPFIWIGTTLPAFSTAAHVTSASPIYLALRAQDRAALRPRPHPVPSRRASAR